MVSIGDVPRVARHETASDSELLQSPLPQPLNINPPPPRLSRQAIGIFPLFEPTRLGYNEFSPLFASDRLGLLTDGFAGNFGTVGGTLLANGLYRNLSMSVGQFYSRTDGIHDTGDLRRRITDFIFQPAPLTKLACLPSFGIPTSMPAIFKTASISPTSIRTNARQTTPDSIVWAGISMRPRVSLSSPSGPGTMRT